MTIEQLQQLGRHRWIVPLLAEMAARNGARFAELLHALPVSRESLARTINCAIEEGWIARNPGHGHPLRPEYILTESGRCAAPTCASVMGAQAALAIAPAALSRWSLPLVRVIDAGERRFCGMARALPDSNPRALSQSLKGLAENALLSRAVIDDHPPVCEYGLTARGERLAAALA